MSERVVFLDDNTIAAFELPRITGDMGMFEKPFVEVPLTVRHSTVVDQQNALKITDLTPDEVVRIEQVRRTLLHHEKSIDIY